LKSKKYLYQFGVLLVWMICVVLLFKFIESKQIASVWAGLGFVAIPIVLLLLELRQSQKNKLQIFILFLFLILSALPIFLLRILNWGVDFSTLTLAGIPATSLHGISNFFYLLMMLSCLFHAFKR
jgi:hypothetical protein